ncbi:MAG: hypothetical protein PF961_00200 [Planctomycetota bacterium]|jgi:hypothetical protein|nr:hypothetical protein [Planctomycetota bacterium]
MNQNTLVAIVCLLLGVGGATAYFTLTAPAPAPEHGANAGAYCNEHKIDEADCPFCNPAIIEQRGHCDAHQVAEALCYQCNPKLMAAFKAEGDWCGGHNVPESQCEQCEFGAVHQGPDAKPKL